MKRKMIVAVFLLMSSVLLSACSGLSHADDNRIQIVFWHSMAGPPLEALNKIVNDFNQSQDEIYVKPEYQGSYEESLAKFRRVGGTDNAPNIYQAQDIGSKYMIESGDIVPVQQLMDEEHYNMNQLERNIRNYYTVNGKLYSMPFNSSTPVVLYNADAFKKAGLDPNKPPETYSQFREAAKKLTQANKGMKGFSFLNYPWFFEELLAVQGGEYINQNNGRTGLATKATFNSQKGLNIFKWLREMQKDGTLANYGTSGDNESSGFLTQKVGMFMSSSASMAEMFKNAPFKVGVAYIPRPDNIERQGVVIGGASLWLSKGKSAKEEKAAFAFMKYMASPKSQADWHIHTGYFPINPGAYKEPIIIKNYKKTPQFKVAVNQFHDTKSTYATRGPMMTLMPQSRVIMSRAIDDLYQGKNLQQSLDTAADHVNEAIAQMNLANKK
ncbi:ABC transporter substrate-binding protein [Terrilactibacillus laevilacticus]|uniref:ABC transporter substrate-binding protein n=1 Tax=Terrilactibacillus laevilacticus TaxID=1380157 RepID=A0ABW5PQR8_9BACI|nr:ABC transporter substrate-binding protein [Terrilactibacillus laevilacticus]